MLKHTTIALLLMLSLGEWPEHAGAESSDINLTLDISTSYHIQEGYLQSDPSEFQGKGPFSNDRSYALVNLHPSLSICAGKKVCGQLGVDAIWENPVEELEQEATVTEVTTAYLSFKGSNLRSDIGRQPVTFGNGLILDDSVLAGIFHISVNRFYAELKVARATEESPMVGLTLGYEPGFFEHLELFGIWFEDQDDTLAGSVRVKNPFWEATESSGSLYFVGAAANLFLGDTLLTFTGAVQTGEFTAKAQTIGGRWSFENDIDFSSYMGDISLTRNLGRDWSVGVFYHVASGDNTPKEPTDGKSKAFVTITPYNPRAVIFWDAEFTDRNDYQRMTFGGGIVSGVIAPGISLTYLSGGGADGGLAAEATLISLYAHKALNDGSRWYGWEADLSVSYTFKEKYRFFVEVAQFTHGDYIESLLKQELDPAYRCMAGLQASF